MPIRHLVVQGYRSIPDLRLRLGRLNVLVGPNGCGKSNLYRSLVLLAAAAEGRLARAIADEGGMPSAMWRGDRKKGPARLRVTVTVDELEYTLSCGVRPPGGSAFVLDPLVRLEEVVDCSRDRRVTVLRRRGAGVEARRAGGATAHVREDLLENESVFAQIREPHRYPELSILRQEILSWRFYHHFDTRPEAPIRARRPGVLTPSLSADGSDLAAALQTIREMGQLPELAVGVERAFPGQQICIECWKGTFGILFKNPAFKHPFTASELSDGTLRYLCLLAALLAPQPPAVVGLNEPENSLHPDLLEPLARLIVDASQRSQMWITTHSQALAGYIEAHSGEPPVELYMVDGETRVEGQEGLSRLLGYSVAEDEDEVPDEEED